MSDLLGERPASLARLVEGLESQAFRFDVSAGTLVLRISRSVRGFEKDAWAHAALGGRVPVPRVLRLGWIDREHAYCITEWRPA